MEKFNTIYVDPPLALGALNLEGFRSLPIHDLSARDAMLFLWFPSPELPEYVHLLAGWGFTYVQLWSWLRGATNNKYPYEHLAEHMLIGIKGMVRTDYLFRRNLFDCGRSEGSFHPQGFKDFALRAATRAFSPPTLLDLFGSFWRERDMDYWRGDWHWWDGSLKY